jgi:hypothetical protein
MLGILGTLITLVLAGGTPPDQPPRGVVVEHLVCPADPTQMYSLYLPST